MAIYIPETHDPAVHALRRHLRDWSQGVESRVGLLETNVKRRATTKTLGQVMPDNDTIVVDSKGVISTTARAIGIQSINGDTTPAQTFSEGTGITIVDNGLGDHEISTSAAGVTEVDTTAPITGGPITSTGTIAVSNATSSTVGVVKPDNSTITISAGVISAVAPAAPAIPGPYADDTAAAAGGVAIGRAYYLTTNAFMVVRLV